MPLRNRVDPFSRLIATPARGTLMGNRGILHDEGQSIRRNHGHKAWICCFLAFKGRKRMLMAPHRYTELFFLDEATAFAAGHRPCAECRRARYRAFADAWCKTHGSPPKGQSLAKAIDDALHEARVAPGGRQVTFTAQVGDLPDGAFLAQGDQAMLVWQGWHWDWSFAGYRRRSEKILGSVTVLTPHPLVRLFAAGFRPEVHDSLDPA